MHQKNIELELRTEILKNTYNRLLTKLKKNKKLDSHTKRLSVMCFGNINKSTLDIRIRITNDKSEVVIKKENCTPMIV